MKRILSVRGIPSEHTGSNALKYTDTGPGEPFASSELSNQSLQDVPANTERNLLKHMEPRALKWYSALAPGGFLIKVKGSQTGLVH